MTTTPLGGRRWRYELEPAGTGTRVTESFVYSSDPALRARVVEVLRVPGRNAWIHETLAELRVAAEQDAQQDATQG